MYDLIITNARIIDGSGAPAYHGAVAIKNGKIAAVGQVEGSTSETLDAKGRVVCPGFIDVHTHYDAQIFWDGTLSPSCYHGVTTVLGGFCGFSIAPLSKDAAPYLLRMLSRVEGMPESSLTRGVPWDWASFGEYLHRIEGRLGVNAGFMAGHSAIRRVVMGERAVGEKATAEDLKAMTGLLARCLEEGALGFSSTVSPTHNDADGNPVPSRFADREEFLALARVCQDYPGTTLEFLPHLTMDDDAKQLMSDLSVAAQRPLNWNALTASKDPQMIEHRLSATDIARANGGEVLALTIPQPISLRINLHSGFIFDSFPGWADLFQKSVDERIEALKDPARRRELDRGARSDHPLKTFTRWEDFTVETVFNETNKPLEGRTVGDIAAEQGKAPFDTLLDLAVSENLRTSFHVSGTGADDGLWQTRADLWQDDRVLIGASDAGAHLDMLDTFAFSTKVLGEGVRKRHLLSLEKAVHLMTQVPATAFGIRKRGLLKEGWQADVVVFDPGTVEAGPIYVKTDLPGNEMRLYSDASGIHHVFVNGVQTIRDGLHTDALPGTVLRSGKETYTPALRHAERVARMQRDAA